MLKRIRIESYSMSFDPNNGEDNSPIKNLVERTKEYTDYSQHLESQFDIESSGDIRSIGARLEAYQSHAVSSGSIIEVKLTYLENTDEADLNHFRSIFKDLGLKRKIEEKDLSVVA